MVFSEIVVSEGRATISIKKGTDTNLCVEIIQSGATTNFILPRQVIDSFINAYNVYNSQGNLK